MPAYDENALNKMAERAVDNFIAQNAALDDATAQEAQQNNLNPDQVKRLVEAANTQAFLKLMDQQKSQGASDLTQEFSPVDASRVIKIVIDSSGAHVESDSGDPSCNSPDMSSGMQDINQVPDEMSAIRNPQEAVPQAIEDAPTDKTDKTTKVDKTDKVKAPKKDKGKDKAKEKEAAFIQEKNTRRKIAALEDERHRVSYQFDDLLNGIVLKLKIAQAKGANHVFDDMLSDTDFTSCKEAFVVMNTINKRLSLPEVTQDQYNKKLDKLASHFPGNDEYQTLFNEIVKLVKHANRVEQAYQQVIKNG